MVKKAFYFNILKGFIVAFIAGFALYLLNPSRSAAIPSVPSENVGKVEARIHAILKEEPHFLDKHFRSQFVNYLVATAKDYQFDPFLILAVMKVESSFKLDAKSYAGALGLMQLKPIAAKEVSIQFDTKPIANKELFNPFVNIKTGIQYLAFIRNLLGHSKEHMLSAYNLGPYRVKESRIINGYAYKVLKIYKQFLARLS